VVALTGAAGLVAAAPVLVALLRTRPAVAALAAAERPSVA
jgi:hypothetical protein